MTTAAGPALTVNDVVAALGSWPGTLDVGGDRAGFVDHLHRALAAIPPSAPLALDVERLAKAMYEDAIAIYRRKKMPSWVEMVANPSLPMGTQGRDKEDTRRSSLESWRATARRIFARLEQDR